MALGVLPSAAYRRRQRVISICLLTITTTILYHVWHGIYTSGKNFNDNLATLIGIAGHAAEWMTSPRPANDEACTYRGSLDTSKIVVVVTASDAEVLDVLPTTLVTSLRCVADPVLLAHTSHHLGQHTIHAIVDESESGVDTGHAILSKAWNLRPQHDWYVFLKPDTYLSWQGLLHELELTPVPSTIISGSLEGPCVLGNCSSQIISGGTLQNHVEQTAPLREKFKADATRASPRDLMSTEVAQHLPLLLPGPPSLIAFGPHIWCQPVVTVGGISTDEMSVLSEFDMKMARQSSAVLFKHLFDGMHPTGLPFKRENWNNHAADLIYAIKVVSNDLDRARGQWEPKDLKDPHGNYMACEIACIQAEECFQFSFTTTTEHGLTTNECHLSSVFRSGEPFTMIDNLEGDGEARSRISGWRSDRISIWMENQRCG